MTARDKPAVVIDTNLFISAIIRGGTPYKLLKAWHEDKFSLILSRDLLGEISNVLKREEIYHKYQINQGEITKLLDGLQLNADFVAPSAIADLPVHSRDPKDDKLLACSLSAKADYLITGDEDLLVLNDHPSLKGLKIVSVKEFLSLI